MNAISEIYSYARKTIGKIETIYIKKDNTAQGVRYLCYGVDVAYGIRIGRLGKGSQAVRDISEYIINSDELQDECAQHGERLAIELTPTGYYIEPL